MATIEELINTIITFGLVLLPLWILMSRRRRIQQERSKRSETPPGQRQPDGRTGRPPVAPQRQQPETASGDDYRDRTLDDRSYSREQHARSHPEPVADAPRTREPGRLEKVLRDLLGAPDPQDAHSREGKRKPETAPRKAATSPGKRAAPQARPVEVPQHADIRIQSVMPEGASLSLSPGGMGPQHMRTAAGNLGASASAKKTAPAVGSLGQGWRRVLRLSEFKRAIVLSELLGKPHALKDSAED